MSDYTVVDLSTDALLSTTILGLPDNVYHATTIPTA